MHSEPLFFMEQVVTLETSKQSRQNCPCVFGLGLWYLLVLKGELKTLNLGFARLVKNWRFSLNDVWKHLLRIFLHFIKNVTLKYVCLY